jgi:hypothetical protein
MLPHDWLLAEQLGDAILDGVPILDETDFLKKASQFCGVARQYADTTGGAAR